MGMDNFHSRMTLAETESGHYWPMMRALHLWYNALTDETSMSNIMRGEIRRVYNDNAVFSWMRDMPHLDLPWHGEYEDNNDIYSTDRQRELWEASKNA